MSITAGYVYDASGELQARHIPGDSGLQTYWKNGDGDVTELRNEAGDMLNRYTYDVWGNPRVVEEQTPNVLRYAGEYWDEETGLQYLRSRWYDPNLGRFINEDTYEGDKAEPSSLNLYTYVENNPLIYTDPSGEAKRGEKNALEGLGSGSGSASGSAGMGRSSGGGLGGGGGGLKGGSRGSKPKPSTSTSGQVSQGGNSSVKVNYGNNKVEVYRGGKTFEVRTNEVKLDKKTGLVKTTHGLSLDINPNTISKFGGAYRIDSIPDGLKIIQRGSRLEHFEIVPAYDMTLKMYQDLLNLIKVSPMK
ncbi:RHS repeat-associated core domain-containing protein [Paenibacillus sp. FSL K6-1558]|uniref:RHS repeat-associated core domain-containing protein n=1 Tax=Paenibacillus sp. FSL K6-1558 TaxID=2921473 RepID=UPI001C9981B0|nr:RHS repeat-associated core domain-containing protein [Paenibacillus xylanexedens]